MFLNIQDETENILFVGVGNRFRNDDNLGIYICEKIKNNPEINVLIAENSLENYIGKINKLKPGTTIIIDAMNLNREPGYFEMIPISHIFDSTANTHTISLKQLSTLISSGNIYILGIQPKDISYGTKITERVQKSADLIIENILNLYLKN